MKFFAVLILPMDVDSTDAKMVENTVSALMRPFKMWEDDVPVERGQWDYYWCCTKDWMAESRLEFAAHPSSSSDQAPMVFALDQVSSDGITDSIITPHGEWHRSKATYTEEDPSWESKALSIFRSFPGHSGVLLFCHG